jgi:hypothetical protein
MTMKNRSYANDKANFAAMLRTSCPPLVKSSLGFMICTLLTIEAHSLHAQTPPRYTEPTPLNGVINDSDPGSPSISGDGLTMYFGAYHGSTTPTLWQATRPSIGADWENAQQLSDAVNSQASQLEPDVTEDGLELYFRASDSALDDYLMVATRTSTEDTWGEAERLPDTINNLPCISKPAVTGDGLELYFASIDTPGQPCRSRNADVYVSKRATRDDAWEEPQSVESRATTPGISSDGLRLYFVEGDRAGTGLPEGTRADGPNVFVRTRNSRDEGFGPPVELGDPPNTSGSMFAVWGPEESSNGDTLYFSSDRSGAPHEWGIWQTTPVPEPASSALLLIGMTVICRLRQRR